MADIDNYFTVMKKPEKVLLLNQDYTTINLPEIDIPKYYSTKTSESEKSEEQKSSSPWFNISLGEVLKSNTSNNLNSTILKYLNIPYVYGGNSKNGIDCSAFTSNIFKDLGYNIGRTSVDQYKNTSHINPEDVQVGDLYFLKGTLKDRDKSLPSHVGIVTGIDKNTGKLTVAEASHKGTVSTNNKTIDLNSDYYKQHFLGFGRVSNQISSAKNGGTMEIVIEQKEEKEDPIGCLLCQIMNALGLRHHALSETKTDKLSDILGGNAQIIIEIGGPEKVEDSFEGIIKEILPLISDSKKYTKEDIAEIRKDKEKHGDAMKKLLTLMSDGNILKAFNGMQLFKNGGSVKKEIKVREAISGDEITLPDNLDLNLLSGKKPILTTKGTIYLQNNKAYYAKNIDPRIKAKAEGGQIEEVSTVNVKIGNKEYTLFEAKTEEEKEKGLMGVENLENNEGMIFYYDDPQEVSFWMKDTEIALDICFFNEDEECISIKNGTPLSEEAITEQNVMFVVEVPAGSNIKPGDELDFPGDDDEYVMLVIGSDGNIQYQLKGGERIVSRKETKVLIKKAKRAYAAKNTDTYDARCKSLGRYIFKVLDGLDGREAEYVTLDSKK